VNWQENEMETSSLVKKLAVIPFEEWNMMQQQTSNTNTNILTSPEFNYLNSLDTELKQILFDVNLPSEIKFNKYLDLKNKYNVSMSKIKKPLEIEIKDNSVRIPSETIQKSRYLLNFISGGKLTTKRICFNSVSKEFR